MKSAEKRRLFDAVVWSVSSMFAVTLMVHEAHAGEHRYTVNQADYQKECASCHIAYPPQLLSAPSWQSLMTGLDRHFGTDAAIDARSAASIGEWLKTNAGSSSKFGTDTQRISETAWFTRKHRKVAGKFKTAAVKSAANCSACHEGAAQGDYSERRIRIPE